MSEFRGFECNGCGAIVRHEERDKEVVRFVGPDGEEGSYYRDLCRRKCSPLRRAEVEKAYQRTPTRAKRRRSGPVVAAAS